jgi:hypothetical protein
MENENKDELRCEHCGHAAHYANGCFNMASDNDCDCSHGDSPDDPHFPDSNANQKQDGIEERAKVLCTQNMNCGRTRWKSHEMDCEGCGLERYPGLVDRARDWVDKNTSMRRCTLDLPQSVLDARNYRLIYLESRLCAFAEAETATLTAERDRLKEALRELVVVNQRVLQTWFHFEAHDDGDKGYKELGDDLEKAYLKAKALTT